MELRLPLIKSDLVCSLVGLISSKVGVEWVQKYVCPVQT